MSAFAEAANHFAVDLHKVFKSQKQFVGQNLFYSPASISIALGMLYNGARGSTAQEISKGCHWDHLKIEQVNQHMKEFNGVLSAANTASNQITTANRLFLEQSCEVLQEFIDCCKTYYDAEAALVDYKNDSEGARKKINAWVEEKTNKKIQDLLPSGSLNPRTRATLVNAIYFKGLWEKQFKKEHTFPSKFFLRENEENDVDMMFQTSKFNFINNGDLDCQLLEMPYAGSDMSMVVILPNKIEGLQALEEKLTYNSLHSMVSSVHDALPMKVEVSMPKFSMTREIDLNDMLKVMGMAEMFDDMKADFLGITNGPERVHVSKVYHKAFVDVNEEGTEAAAATAAVMMTRMMVRPTPSFIVDHPFFFLITHCKSGAILFMGRVTKPESSK